MRFKYFQLVILIFFINNLTAQNENVKIDSSNYYNFYSQNASRTSWIDDLTASYIITEEMKKRQFDWLYNFSLYKLQSGEQLVLTAYSRKSNFGFIYVGGHSMFPKKSERRKNTYQSMTGNKYEFAQCQETFEGEPDFIKLEKMQKNIYLLFENDYWYQDTSDTNLKNKLVTREIAINILRQDIRKILNEAEQKFKK